MSAITIDKAKVLARMRRLGIPSQRQLALRMGMHAQRLNHILNTGRFHPDSLARLIAPEVLNCPPEALLSYTYDPEPVDVEAAPAA